MKRLKRQKHPKYYIWAKNIVDRRNFATDDTLGERGDTAQQQQQQQQQPPKSTQPSPFHSLFSLVPLLLSRSSQPRRATSTPWTKPPPQPDCFSLFLRGPAGQQSPGSPSRVLDPKSKDREAAFRGKRLELKTLSACSPPTDSSADEQLQASPSRGLQLIHPAASSTPARYAHVPTSTRPMPACVSSLCVLAHHLPQHARHDFFLNGISCCSSVHLACPVCVASGEWRDFAVSFTHGRYVANLPLASLTGHRWMMDPGSHSSCRNQFFSLPGRLPFSCLACGCWRRFSAYTLLHPLSASH